MRQYGWRSWVCPNFTPDGWWECDLAQVTKSLYFREFEIKLSRSDFKADAGKSRSRYDRTTRQYVEHRKHDLLSQHVEHGPVQFNYVTPQGLLDKSEIPEWAGLIEIIPHKTHWMYSRMKQIKSAPRLHRKKSPKLVDEITLAGYYRYVRHRTAQLYSEGRS